MPNLKTPGSENADPILGDSSSILSAVFEAMAEGVVVQDQEGAIVACNASAERILGLTADQMRGLTSMDPRWKATHEDGSPFPGDTHPAMVTLRTGQPTSDVIMGVHRPEQTFVWILINSRPLNGADGKTEAAVTTFADITQFRELLDERERLAAELQKTLTTALSNFIPICANCKSIRDSDSKWVQLERYMQEQTGTEFSHTVCPACVAELYPTLDLDIL